MTTTIEPALDLAPRAPMGEVPVNDLNDLFEAFLLEQVHRVMDAADPNRWAVGVDEAMLAKIDRGAVRAAMLASGYFFFTPPLHAEVQRQLSLLGAWEA